MKFRFESKTDVSTEEIANISLALLHVTQILEQATLPKKKARFVSNITQYMPNISRTVY